MDRYQNGTLTLKEFYRRTSDGDEVDEDQFTVTIGGQTIEYGSYPKPVADELITAARNGVSIGEGEDERDPMSVIQSAGNWLTKSEGRELLGFEGEPDADAEDYGAPGRVGVIAAKTDPDADTEDGAGEEDEDDE